jgi:hypothetical protein
MKNELLTGQAQVKGTMLNAHLKWLEKQGVSRSALAPHMPPDLSRILAATLATDWITLRSLIAVDRAIAAAVTMPADDVFRELGRFSASSNLTGVYSAFAKAEPHRFFTTQAMLHDHFQNFGASAYQEVSERAGVMRLTQYTEYSPVFCLSAVGYYQGALETLKAPGPIRIRETQCTCSGDEACTFELRW